jgi:hypothetical protein
MCDTHKNSNDVPVYIRDLSSGFRSGGSSRSRILAPRATMTARSIAWKVEPQLLERITPAHSIASNDRARPRALRETLAFLKVDFLTEARPDVPARIPHDRPAHPHAALAVVVQVLFCHVQVVPGGLLLETARCGVVVDLDDFSPHGEISAPRSSLSTTRLGKDFQNEMCFQSET